MSFRARYPHAPAKPHLIGFIWLNHAFDIVSEPQIMKNVSYVSERERPHDPRLVVVAEKLYIVFSSLITTDIWEKSKREERRMVVASVYIDRSNGIISIGKGIPILEFEGQQPFRMEKNWAPFDYNGSLVFESFINPHRVCRPTATGNCITIGSSNSSIQRNWSWGEIRGGTPPLRIVTALSSEYLVFFHSSTYVGTFHSNGSKMPHYVMGAYTFAVEPPFRILRRSARPLFTKGLYTSPKYPTWIPLRVVFPSGCIGDSTIVWITFGKQDHELWVAKLDMKGLLKSMVPL